MNTDRQTLSPFSLIALILEVIFVIFDHHLYSDLGGGRYSILASSSMLLHLFGNTGFPFILLIDEHL